MRNVVGQAVIGRDLFGRETELRRLWENLAQGEHIHMLAPRRVGKTSLMLEMRRKPLKQWHVVYVDVEGAVSPADCVAALIAELAASPTYRSWLESVPFGKSLSDIWQQLRNSQVTTPFLRVELKSAMGKEWPDALDRLQARLANLPESEAHLLLVVDEFSILISRMLRAERGRDDVELMLAKLRGWRQSPALRGKVQMLVGGSIGLDGLLRRERLSALINDLVPFRLESWDRETAAAFIRKLGRDRNFRLTDTRISTMLDLLNDPVPYHVQLFFRELSSAANGSAQDVTRDQVCACFADRLTGPGGSPYLDHYAARLEVMLDREGYEAAMAMLGLACEPTGTTTADLRVLAGERELLYRSVLNDLESDGYIVRNGERIQFRSNLLRAWWRKLCPGGAR